MDDRQLIADLLSALEYHTEQTRPIEFSKVAIEAAREYLRKPVQQWSAGVPPLYPEPEPGVSIKAEYEQPAQQEPVAWGEYIPCCTDQTCSKCKAATPPQRKPLSDEEIYSLADSLEIWNEEDEEWILDPNTFARAIEAAHGIKGEA